MSTTGPEQASARAASRHTLSDEVLVLRVARGDRPAFAELYQRYARPTFGLALGSTADHEQAELATRTAFAAVWRSAASFDPAVADARDWLLEVVSEAVDAHLARAPEAARATDDADPAGRQRRWRVHRALAELPPGQVAAVELVTWGGLSVVDAARYLGVPPETARARAREGYARLGELLGDG